MKRTFKLLILLGLLLLNLQLRAQSAVVINEFVASNQSGLVDTFGNRSDWIELYNRSNSFVNIQGYYISDTEGELKWQVEEPLWMSPQSFILLFASGKDTIVGSERHTNFSISRSGETIILANRNGAILDQIPPVSLEQDVAYLRYPDGADSFYYSGSPTPLAPNQKGKSIWVSTPQLSLPSGFYSSDFQLSMHCAVGEEIRYTTDGSEPDAQSTRYESPVSVVDLPENAHITDKWMSHFGHPNRRRQPFNARIVQARCFKDGYAGRDVAKATYWIGRKPHEMPVISLMTKPFGLFDDSSGILVPGIFYEPGNRWTGNYMQRGADWERPTYMEFFDENGQKAFDQEIGLRVHGNESRSYYKKSFRLYSRRDYDRNQGRFDYPFFENTDQRDFNRLILRQSGQEVHPEWHSRRGVMFRDVLMQSLVRDMNFETQNARASVLYLNGVYWGIYNIRERHDHHYLNTKYQFEERGVDIISYNIGLFPAEIQSGTLTRYRQFIDTLAADVEMDAIFLNGLMDVRSFMDFFAANIYFNNGDWPMNNTRLWRYRKITWPAEGEMEPKDGRWRSMLFDTDFGFGFNGHYKAEMLDYAFHDSHQHYSLPIRRILEVPELKTQFISNFADYLNHHFRPSRVLHQINEMEAIYEPEMEENLNRWGGPNMGEWRRNVGILREFAFNRPHYVRQDLQKYFKLQAIYQLVVDVSDELAGSVQVNELPPAHHDYPWDGFYFEDIPVMLKALPEAGFSFAYWADEEGLPIAFEREIEVQAEEHTYYQAVFEAGTAEDSPPSVFEWNDPHLLREGNFVFNHWEENTAPATMPHALNLIQVPFHQLEEEVFYENWALDFQQTDRSGFVGYGEDGLSLKVTDGRRNHELAGYPHAVVLSVDSRGVSQLLLNGLFETISSGQESFDWYLCYRIGQSGRFRPLNDMTGKTHKWRVKEGNQQRSWRILLPTFLGNRELIQLAFFYQQSEPSSNLKASPELRIKSLELTGQVNEQEYRSEEEEEEVRVRFTLFPNPVQGVFQIRDDFGNFESRESMQVYDMKGKMVFRGQLNFINGLSQPIDLQGLPNGTYIVQILRPGMVATEKLIYQSKW